jgi:hypothetical protein
MNSWPIETTEDDGNPSPEKRIYPNMLKLFSLINSPGSHREDFPGAARLSLPSASVKGIIPKI